MSLRFQYTTEEEERSRKSLPALHWRLQAVVQAQNENTKITHPAVQSAAKEAFRIFSVK